MEGLVAGDKPRGIVVFFGPVWRVRRFRACVDARLS